MNIQQEATIFQCSTVVLAPPLSSRFRRRPTSRRKTEEFKRTLAACAAAPQHNNLSLSLYNMSPSQTRSIYNYSLASQLTANLSVARCHVGLRSSTYTTRDDEAASRDQNRFPVRAARTTPRGRRRRRRRSPPPLPPRKRRILLPA
jgi:hypothetical protein